MKNFDAIVIGFGKGGKTLAGKLAAAGKKVAVVERDAKMYGGTCINVGCIPSKSLVKSAGLAARMSMDWEERKAYYQKAVAEKEALTTALRQKNFDKLNHFENVSIVNGTASFLSNTEVEVELAQGGTERLRAEQIFINTGGTAVIPPIEGLSGNPGVYTSAELMDLRELPKRLVIIGGGYIGLEFASMYAGFGSRVAVAQDGEVLIPREDRDIAAAIQGALEEKGVTFHLGVTVRRVVYADGQNTVEIEKDGAAERLPADAVLVATGRRPNTGLLKAQNAGVELTNRGAVVVDAALKTTAPNIWAMGDVTGGLQFTYTSLDDYRVVWSQLQKGGYTLDSRKAVPYSVFIDPPFSRVGLSEEEARRAGYEVRVAKMPAAAIPKAQVLSKPRGLLKAVVDARTDRVLGAMLFCEESYETINLIKLAMDAELPYQALRDQIYTHPTMTEALNDLFDF